ncbi:ATP-dependent DNA helicase [Variovorax sp. dw_308]|uniref:ATP-dependent DNA helicase n=1 Tax=Variovorax sp. dw_308 TaxID=2721546 RepID=UPI001C490D08|nr:ATP-dependent DNA helicase [Variovorax sp. dw_308]
MSSDTTASAQAQPPSADCAEAPPPLAAARAAVSVKALCAFGAKVGDLDFRFVPVPSAQEGMAGHSLVQSRRGADYEREVTLSAIGAGLLVRGRADGYDARRRRVEEIKTFRGSFDAIRANHRALHWAQARCYGWMLCERESLDEIAVALVYLDLASGEETVLEERWPRDALRAHFEHLCVTFMAWAERQGDRQRALQRELGSLSFPHAAFRPGQRELARGVYRAAAAGRCLIAQAPTGIGKTVATTWPLLRGWATQKTHKIFFLTAKTPGRAVALEALGLAGRDSESLRVLELTAREKACEHPGKSCDGEACPLARGFYDRLPDARREAIGTRELGRAQLRSIAQAHAVCPYFLAQEMARWSDVIVADYNYYFDSSAFLFALAKEEEWRVAVLVDEAHNLLERARGMYTAPLAAQPFEEAQRAAPTGIKPRLVALRREWRALQAGQAAGYAALDAIPERLLQPLQEAVSAIAEHFAATPRDAHGPLQRFFFDMVYFLRLSDAFGSHSVFEVTSGDDAGGDALTIRNLVPAPFLKPRFAASMSTVCFSGTIAPFPFYRDMLGLPDDTLELDVASPFQPHQLSVQVTPRISTRFHHRAGSLDALIDLVGAQFMRRPGNYLAFFSSFDYLEAAHATFAQRWPGIPTWSQSRRMAEADREAFVARFQAGGQGVGFAVLGGAFGEGVDLPGDRLIGAFIASLGLPQHNPMNEVMRERMETLFSGQGYNYTYLYPGLRKVVQAAGRVIRTESDSGVVYLLDDRFERPEVRRLLPSWWQLERYILSA